MDSKRLHIINNLNYNYHKQTEKQKNTWIGRPILSKNINISINTITDQTRK